MIDLAHNIHRLEPLVRWAVRFIGHGCPLRTPARAFPMRQLFQSITLTIAFTLLWACFAHETKSPVETQTDQSRQKPSCWTLVLRPCNPSRPLRTSTHIRMPSISITTIRMCRWRLTTTAPSSIFFHDQEGLGLADGTRFYFETFGFPVEAQCNEYVPPVN